MTQTNWSLSNALIGLHCFNMSSMLNEIKTELENVFSENEIKDIFKSSTNDQFFKQCEIDVVGIKFGDVDYELGNIGASPSAAFLYDTAFHEDGLHYKDTKSNVIKKIIRASVIGMCQFNEYNVIRIGFISPKCNKTLTKGINDAVARLYPILVKYNSKIKIDLYLNNSCDDLINDLVDMTSDIKDDNDLFIRSIKLLNLTTKNANSPSSPKVGIGSNKGIVLGSITKIILHCKKSGTKILVDLQDKNYSKTNFGIYYPFLIEISKINEKDQNRFYPDVFLIDGKSYRVCSQWIPERIEKLHKWFEGIKF